ncbi:DPP IV N-terminal domain-containing protein [Ekhidna sp.]|uniref:TolB family protein n=1 Tax=Ekhidna sp. TaxID=2608089 RepID=UPI0032ECA7EB
MKLRLFYSILQVGFILANCTYVNAQTEPNWSLDSRQIAFVIYKNDHSDIYTMKADGTEVKRLTSDGSNEWFPRWSPDGRRVLFWSDRGGNSDIYVMNADGSSVKRLTSDKAKDRYGSWSPDGNKIVFNSDRNGVDNIFILDLKTDEVTQLTFNEKRCSFPNWSPDGDLIVYRMDYNIYTISVAGGKPNQLTTDGSSSAPYWSPDGLVITYYSSKNGGVSQIYSIDKDGNNEEQLTSSNSENDECYYGQISSDGNWLLYRRGVSIEKKHMKSGKTIKLIEESK